MAQLPAKLLQWLHNVLSSEYRDVQRTYSDAVQLLSSFPALRPKTEVYTYENGYSALLLHITGTIPIAFRNSTFYTPVSIWVPQVYPREAPISYVVQSDELKVRPGQYVTAEGKIYHPYLANWRPDRSQLLGLLQTLQDAFAREPPVVARGGQGYPPYSSPEDTALPPRPPKATTTNNFVDSARSASANQGGAAPQPPPKPFSPSHQDHQARFSDRPPSHPNGFTGNQSENRQGSEYRPMPPRPDQYQSHGTAIPRYNGTPSKYQQPFDSRSQPIPQISSPSQEYRQYDSPLPTPYRQDQASHPANRQPPYATIMPAYPSQYPQAPPHQATFPQKFQQRPPPHISNQTPKPQPPPPPADLLTSADEAQQGQSSTSQEPKIAPPIPPNPHKDALLSHISHDLTNLLHTRVSENHSKLAPLRAQQSAIQSSLRAMTQESQSLQSLSALLTSNEQILHKAMRDADAVIGNAKHRSVPAVDEVLVAPTVVGEQLYGLIAEERACGEARAMLTRALDAGRIGVEGWVKGVRGLAREEFLKKALIKKAAKGMGLREGDG